jgi:trk system potassium uptake protein TrkH
LGTSSGYGNATTPGSAGDFVTWIPSVQMILLFLMVVGACTGSTSGAVKVTRLQILTKHSVRSVRRTQSPHAVIPIRLGARAVPEGVVARISSFFLVYLLLVIAGVIAITALGSGLLEAVGAVVGSLGGMGPALGEAGPTANFTDAFSEPARLVLALLMVIGRLELFPMLLMFAAPIRAVRDL